MVKAPSSDIHLFLLKRCLCLITLTKFYFLTLPRARGSNAGTSRNFDNFSRKKEYSAETLTLSV